MGLGRAMAIALARQGANIVIADVNQEAGKQTAKDVMALDVRSLYVLVDVRNQKHIAAALEATLKEFRTVDILVNNAGIGRPRPSFEVSRDEWQEVIDINLTGLFFMSQSVGRVMATQKSGVIINIASMSAFIVNHEVAQSSYYASKAGVVMVTKALAAEWSQYNIRVNAIAPGVMMTNQTKYMFDDPSKREMISKWMDYTPLRRPGKPEELGGAVVYLASDASSYMTGNVLVVDGGYTTY
jgi:NAD(P)-dependent dehydrogenase (short-subunit alcohol dehydrogenase family)